MTSLAVAAVADLGSAMAILTRTLLAASPTALLSSLSQLSALISPSHTVIFALSANVPTADLESLLNGLSAIAPRSLGCLSAPLPPRAGHTSKNVPQISCSIGSFPDATCVPFRSIIPGKRAPQVGRWHAFREKDDVIAPSRGMRELEEGVNWEDVWAGAGTRATPSLPKELESLR